MKTAFIIAAVLIAGSLHAQSLPDKPTVRVKLVDEAINKPVTLSLPVPHKTADRAFWMWTSISNGMTVDDTENSLYSFKNPAVHELDPVFGRHPSRARFYAIGAPIGILQTWVSYKEKRSNDAALAFGAKVSWYNHWWLLPLANTIAHAAAIGISVANTGR